MRKKVDQQIPRSISSVDPPPSERLNNISRGIDILEEMTPHIYKIYLGNLLDCINSKKFKSTKKSDSSVYRRGIGMIKSFAKYALSGGFIEFAVEVFEDYRNRNHVKEVFGQEYFKEAFSRYDGQKAKTAQNGAEVTESSPRAGLESRLK